MNNAQTILDGIDDVIDESLMLRGIVWRGSAITWKSKKAAQVLSFSSPSPRDRMLQRHSKEEVEEGMRRLPLQMLKRLERNWDIPEEKQDFRLRHIKSKENWRNVPQPKPSTGKPESEVSFQREVVQDRSPYWINHVPTCSGFGKGTSVNQCAVDLAHDCGQGRWELIELKIADKNPLYAAVEILRYGMLYVFSRLYYPVQDMARTEGLLREGVSEIGLRVLAPQKYYDEKFKLGWLKVPLNAGLEDVIKNRDLPGLNRMDFDFCFFKNGLAPLQAVEARESYNWEH